MKWYIKNCYGTTSVTNFLNNITLKGVKIENIRIDMNNVYYYHNIEL